jgi:uncharacterized protein YceH (UPF0502 family)
MAKFMEKLSALEARVLGVLIEKESTTPDQYPMSPNAITLACNQKTNRDPVTSYAESEVRQGLESLQNKHLILRYHGVGSRTAKFKHQIADRFACNMIKLQTVSALWLRGAQTPGEILMKIKRACPDLNLEVLMENLEAEASNEMPWFGALERQPGQKEARWVEFWTQNAVETSEMSSDVLQRTPDQVNIPNEAVEVEKTENREELEILKEEVSFLRDEVQDLKSELEDLRSSLSE